MKLKIKNKTFDVKVVTEEDDMVKGLRGVKRLNKYEGMLFSFDEPQEVQFEMDDTLIDLDIIFIDEDCEVISLEHGKAGESEDYFVEDDVKYVLEINPDVIEVKPGMEVKFLNEKMHILDENGETQMVIKGNERVFSRKNTKTLVKLAKDADRLKTDSAYKKLGKKIFDYLNIQEDNDEEYVELPTKKEE